MIISPKSNIGATELFRNETVLRYFLSDVLAIPAEKIKSVRLSNTFLWRRYKNQKLGILDVLAVMNDLSKINIEIQVKQIDRWDKRQLFYLAKLYSEDLRLGEDYSRLKRCVAISLLDFNLTDRDKYHTVFRLRDEEGYEFSDVFEVHTVELRKKLTGNSPINEWIQFFNVETEADLHMIKSQNPGIRTAVEEIRVMSLRKRLRLRYEAHMKEVRDNRAWKQFVQREAREQGLNEGRVEGRVEGETLKLISLARKKASKHISAEECADMLETDYVLISQIYKLILEHPDWDDLRIYQNMR